MNRVKLQISVLKDFIRRDEKGAKRLKKLYQKQTVTERLNENKFTYEKDY
jgi:hypothetical protein